MLNTIMRMLVLMVMATVMAIGLVCSGCAFSTVHVVTLNGEPNTLTPDPRQDLTFRLESEQIVFSKPAKVELMLHFDTSKEGLKGQVIYDLIEAGKLEVVVPSGETVTKLRMPLAPTNLRFMTFLTGVTLRFNLQPGEAVDLNTKGIYHVVWSSGQIRTNTVILEVQ